MLGQVNSLDKYRILLFSHPAYKLDICSIYSKILHQSASANSVYPGFEVIKRFPCSAQLSMKFFLLINAEVPTI